MKKKKLILLTLLFAHLVVNAQGIHDSLSEDVIKNAPYIIEGYMSGSYYCNCLSDYFYDEIIYIRLTSVISGENINIGDTILLLNPHVGDGKKDRGAIISPRIGNSSRLSFVHCPDGKGCGGQFLTLNKEPLLINELNSRKVFVLYPSSTCSCFLPKDVYSENQEFEITALNWLKFKTKHDWYNYLKQFQSIKVPFDK